MAPRGFSVPEEDHVTFALMVQFPMKMARVVSKVVADGTFSEEDYCRETLGLYGASWDARDCRQKRQQRCTEGAGPGSGGVILDSSVKLGIFCLKTTLKATDSDPSPPFRMVGL